ncbi:hypothetical protein Atai01_45820 [Amycolatopsis taiwanensis]|uniref:Uncharacterized protein n=1 Tax=Amycolatopsis taiwanensis TaxID=342230 RepID=A0A9W6R3P1_9PSEU|nr:hypothetical protein Atai01_45820 [Amycolatopsis taiwanensis]
MPGATFMRSLVAKLFQALADINGNTQFGEQAHEVGVSDLRLQHLPLSDLAQPHRIQLVRR